jgi:hypothetical protein
MDFDCHVSAEFSCLGWDAMSAQQFNKAIHQRFSDFG